jgi:hypothetical protein
MILNVTAYSIDTIEVLHVCHNAELDILWKGIHQFPNEGFRTRANAHIKHSLSGKTLISNIGERLTGFHYRPFSTECRNSWFGVVVNLWCQYFNDYTLTTASCLPVLRISSVGH